MTYGDVKIGNVQTNIRQFYGYGYGDDRGGGGMRGGTEYALHWHTEAPVRLRCDARRRLLVVTNLLPGVTRTSALFADLQAFLGERLMGVPGMILAPVILHYVKSEASRVAVESKSEEAAKGQPAGA